MKTGNVRDAGLNKFTGGIQIAEYCHFASAAKVDMK
jgi:hypothetical protein